MKDTNELFQFAETHTYREIMLAEEEFTHEDINFMILYKTKIDVIKKELENK